MFLCIPIGNAYYDLVSGQVSGIKGTSRIRGAVKANGEALSSIGPGAGAAPVFPNQTGLDKLAGPFTIFCEGSLEVNSATQNIFKSWESGSGFGLHLAFDDTSTTTNGFFGAVNNSASNFSVPTTTLGLNSELASHRVAIDSDGTNRHLYAYGSLVNTIASAVMPTASANRRTYLHAGFDPTSASALGSFSVLAGWDHTLTPMEHAALAANPWQMFAAPRALVMAATGGGSSSYSYTGAGGFVLGGASGQVRSVTRSASGGLALAGAASVTRNSVQSRVVAAVGGILISGHATVVRSMRKVAAGGVAFAGHALMRTGPLPSFIAGLFPILSRRRRRR